MALLIEDLCSFLLVLSFKSKNHFFYKNILKIFANVSFRSILKSFVKIFSLKYCNFVLRLNTLVLIRMNRKVKNILNWKNFMISSSMKIVSIINFSFILKLNSIFLKGWVFSVFGRCDSKLFKLSFKFFSLIYRTFFLISF
jgi:hypothetical protein